MAKAERLFELALLLRSRRTAITAEAIADLIHRVRCIAMFSR
jgi:predicted DNA-binding transcriptional regulator YafY